MVVITPFISLRLFCIWCEIINTADILQPLFIAYQNKEQWNAYDQIGAKV